MWHGYHASWRLSILNSVLINSLCAIILCILLHTDKEQFPQSDLAKQPFALLTMHGLDIHQCQQIHTHKPGRYWHQPGNEKIRKHKCYRMVWKKSYLPFFPIVRVCVHAVTRLPSSLKGAGSNASVIELVLLGVLTSHSLLWERPHAHSYTSKQPRDSTQCNTKKGRHLTLVRERNTRNSSPMDGWHKPVDRVRAVDSSMSWHFWNYMVQIWDVWW